MKLDVEEHVKIEQMHVMPWWICLLLFLDGAGVLVVSVTACWHTIEVHVLCILLTVLLLVFATTTILSRKYVVFARDVYVEFLKWQAAKTEGETQNSKLSETLLKIWEHREDCKDKSLAVTMKINQTSLSC